MQDKRFRWAAILMGLAMGGFFDGILLHQILQWHHLLSNVRNSALGDLRTQVLADGAFHALMYLVAMAGLWLMLTLRRTLPPQGAGRWFLAFFLIGFGSWHVLDTLVSHWLTGIHRVRTDVDNPLFWDVLWLVLFGLLPALCGWLLRRRTPGGSLPGDTVLPALLMATTLVAGMVSAWPVGGQDGTVVVVLRPGMQPSALLSALSESDARIVWGDRAGTVWVLQRDPQNSLAGLYRHGALYVSGALTPAGCSAWMRL